MAWLFGLSGVAALTYEVTWMRQLGLVFGTSTYAISTVLTVFMAGLALGSLWFGARADRSDHPLRLYAFLEAGIALSALLVPFLLPALDSLYVACFRWLHPGLGVLTLLRLGLSTPLLLLPTIFMGGTFPVMTRAFVGPEARLGRGLGVLYGVNTCGAVLGCFLTGFFFIEHLGLRRTLYLAVGLNLLVALGMALLSRRPDGIVREEPLRARASAAGQAEPPEALPSHAGLRLTLWLIGVSGFVALAGEVVWSRLLTMTLGGGSVYAFSTMLTTLLCGLALGGFLGGRLADRVRSAAGAFALTEMGLGLAVLLQMRLLPRLPLWSFHLYRHARDRWWPLTGLDFLLHFAFLLGPTLLLGLAFPLAGQVYTRRLAAAGHRIGRVYAANTVGGILGSVAGGFLLLPVLGTRGSGLALASLALLGGLVLLTFSPDWDRHWKGILGLGSLALAGAFMITSPSWEREPWRVSPEYRHPENRILYYREGATGTVTAFDAPSGVRYLEVNARNASLTEYASRQTFRFLGHLPLLLHPKPRRVLVVAFGAGMTLGSVAQHPVEQIDCVEICREVLGAAPLFAEWNYRVWEDPRVQVHIEDGRNYLLRTDQRYDCITADPLHPAAEGNGNLYSREYFQLCRDHLAPGGIVCQWLPVTGLFPDHYRRIVATFQSVFPQCSLWYAGDYSILLGTTDEFRIDGSQLRARLSTPRIQASLAEVHLGTEWSFLKCFVLGPSAAARLAKDAPVLVDDHPLLEFVGPKLLQDRAPQILSELVGFRESLRPFLTWAARGPDPALVDRLDHGRQHYLQGRLYSFQGPAAAEREIDEYLAALTFLPEDEDLRHWLRQARQALEAALIPQGTALLARRAYPQAELVFRRLLDKVPESGAAYYHLGRAYHAQGLLPNAVEALHKAIRFAPDRAEPYQLLGRVYVQQGKSEEALAPCRRAIELDPHAPQPHFTLAQAHENLGQREAAIRELQEAIRLDPAWEEPRQQLEGLLKEQGP